MQNDIAQIITSLATLIAALASLMVSLRNGKRAETIHEDVREIREQTDGINAQLVKVTGENEFKKGVIQGRASPKS